MVGFTAPALLAGLASIAVPIAIHFWSHRTPRVIRVGSVKLIAATRPTRARRILLSDIPRLLLRILIIVLAVMCIAGVAWFSIRDAKTTIALIDSRVAADPLVRRQLDSLANVGVVGRWLAPGFPSITDSAPAPVADAWTALSDADAHLSADAFIVAAPAAAQHYSGARPGFASRVTWMRTTSTASTAATTLPGPRRIAVVIVAGGGYGRDAQVVAAGLRAIADTRRIELDIARASTIDPQVIAKASIVTLLGVPTDTATLARMIGTGTVVLADSVSIAGPIPGSIARWRDADGVARLGTRTLGSGTLARVTTRITTDALPLTASAAFADSLATLVLPPADPVRDQVLTDAQRTPALVTAGGTRPTIATELAAIAALLAIIAFVFERSISNRRVAR